METMKKFTQNHVAKGLASNDTDWLQAKEGKPKMPVYFPELRWTWQDLPLAGRGMKLQRCVSSYQALKTHSGEDPYACRVWVSLALLKTAANGYRDDSSLGAALNHREPHLPKGWLLTND
ncbi:zinc finger protein 343 [Pteropus alecto]|uniref:zinc finger protein 343 n=1 Tax=Pteropus alecto TaxID=9402 RepID=UPI000768853A|nr:zinc finger protein 343 [Pteropus alecto]